MCVKDIHALTALDEARWIHSTGPFSPADATTAPSYLQICKEVSSFNEVKGRVTSRWKQKAYSKSALDEAVGEVVVEGIARSCDTYITQSSFLSKQRVISSFAEVREAWVDLDLYDDAADSDHWNEIKVQRIIAHVQQMGIPVPTLVIDSGRGAYLKWIFKRAVTNLPAWNELQEALVALFAGLSVDYQARDAARVFRCIGTLNTKNQNHVKVIAGSGLEFDFTEFSKTIQGIVADELYPLVGKVSTAARSRRQSQAGRRILASIEMASAGNLDALDLYARLRAPAISDKLTLQSLAWSRFLDLRKLAHLRGGFQKGERDLMLFWMTNSLAQAKVITPANWDREVDDLLTAFPVSDDFTPVESGYLSSVKNRVIFEQSTDVRSQSSIKSAGQTEGLKAKSGRDSLPPKGDQAALKKVAKDKFGLYRPTTQYLIDVFAIEEQEQQSMLTLISPAVKYARKCAKRDALDPSRVKRKEARTQWHRNVDELVVKRMDLLGESIAGEAKITPSRIGISACDLSAKLGVERSLVAKYTSKKISQYLIAKKISLSNNVIYMTCPTEGGDAAIAAGELSVDGDEQEAQSKKSGANANGVAPLAKAMSAQEALHNLQELKRINRERIAETVQREHRIGQSRLDGQIARVLARAPGEARMGEVGGGASSVEVPLNLKDERQWANNKVTNMISSSQKLAALAAKLKSSGKTIADLPLPVERISRPSGPKPSSPEPASAPSGLGAVNKSATVGHFKQEVQPPASAVQQKTRPALSHFFAPAPVRPKLSAAARALMAMESPSLPPGTRYTAADWAGAANTDQHGDRFFVIEMYAETRVNGRQVRQYGLTRFVNPDHPENALWVTQARSVDAAQTEVVYEDAYGPIYHVLDDRGMQAVKKLNGCLLVERKTQSNFIEALEDTCCVSFGATCYLARPARHYAADRSSAAAAIARDKDVVSASRLASFRQRYEDKLTIHSANNFNTETIGENPGVHPGEGECWEEQFDPQDAESMPPVG